MGYIEHELKTRGACTLQYFTDKTSTEDYDDMTAALNRLLSDDQILRRGTIFYLPKLKEINGHTTKD